MAGFGTSSDPFEIENIDDLAKVGSGDVDDDNSDYFWDLDSYYILMNDINAWGDTALSTGSYYNSGKGWEPLASVSSEFSGNFDGNNKTIKNLYIFRDSEHYIGLFSYINGGTVKDLNIEYDPEDTASLKILYLEEDEKEYSIMVRGVQYLGSLAGYCKNSTIENCHVQYKSRSIITGWNQCGKLIGKLEGNASTVTECTVIGNNGGGEAVGGLIGEVEGNDGTCTISKCASIFNGWVSGTNYIGGLIGRNYDGYVNQCFSENRVTAIKEGGGLIGYCDNSGSSLSPDIENCFSSGKVTRSEGNSIRFAGFISYINGVEIINSYSLTEIGSYGNGFIKVGESSSVSECFHDIEESKNSKSFPGVDSLISKEMVDINTYSAWDIIDEGSHTSEIWWIIQDDVNKERSYPMLDFFKNTPPDPEPPRPRMEEVPNVVDKHKDEAQDILDDVGFNWTETNVIDLTVQANHVISQDPEVTENLKPELHIGVEIDLNISSKAEVPDLLDKTSSQAQTILNDVGLNLGTETYMNHDDAKILLDKGSWGSSTDYNRNDYIEYSGSNYYCTEPHTSSSTFGDDSAYWEGTTLNINDYTASIIPNKDLIFYQNPPVDSEENPGTGVDIWISKGIKVPNVIDNSLESAESTITDNNLTVGDVKEEYY